MDGMHAELQLSSFIFGLVKISTPVAQLYEHEDVLVCVEMLLIYLIMTRNDSQLIQLIKVSLVVTLSYNSRRSIARVDYRHEAKTEISSPAATPFSQL